jgi:pimeloyl-ACP methyl ester carboxylesterase
MRVHVAAADAPAAIGLANLRRGRMAYQSAGAGPTVIALHGWPGFSRDWTCVLGESAAFAHVVAPDFFGFGDSDVLADDTAEAADEEAFAADIVDLLDQLDVDRAVVAGYDIGSAVAPAVARLAPDRVTALLLLNPTHPGNRNPSPELVAESWYQHFHLLPLAPALLDGHADALRLYLGHFYDHWSGETKIGEDELEAIVRAFGRTGRFASSIAWYRARIERRSRAVEPPPPLPTRTVALWGDRDPMRPLAHREGFEVAYPNSRSQVLANVGHFVPREAPHAVTAALRTLVADR